MKQIILLLIVFGTIFLACNTPQVSHEITSQAWYESTPSVEEFPDSVLGVIIEGFKKDNPKNYGEKGVALVMFVSVVESPETHEDIVYFYLLVNDKAGESVNRLSLADTINKSFKSLYMEQLIKRANSLYIDGEEQLTLRGLFLQFFEETNIVPKKVTYRQTIEDFSNLSKSLLKEQ